jgi:tRNA-binding EMAP/Myf-like protein
MSSKAAFDAGVAGTVSVLSADDAQLVAVVADLAKLNETLASQFVLTKDAGAPSAVDAYAVGQLSAKVAELDAATVPNVVRYYNFVNSALVLGATAAAVPASSIFAEDLSFDEAAYKQAVADKLAKNKVEQASKNADAKAGIGADVVRMKVQVGKVVSAAVHPTENRMYVASIDIAAPEPLTVVCGVADWLPLDQFVGTLVPVITNLKAGDVKGVVSSGRCIVATAADGKKEMVSVPAGAVIGETITYRGYTGALEFDEPLAPKRFHKVLKDFVTTADKEVASQNAVLLTSAGPLTAATIAGGVVA